MVLSRTSSNMELLFPLKEPIFRFEDDGDADALSSLQSAQVSGGDRRVMGVAQNAIATQVSTPAYLLWDVPAVWSLAEAATVPVAYATAYYALLIRGRLRSDFSVLIHSGSGAVGLAAIQICLSRGCEVPSSSIPSVCFPKGAEGIVLSPRNFHFSAHEQQIRQH